MKPVQGVLRTALLAYSLQKCLVHCFARVLTQLVAGCLLGDFKKSVRSDTLGVHHPLRNALAVEVRLLVEQLEVLHTDVPKLADGQAEGIEESQRERAGINKNKINIDSIKH